MWARVLLVLMLVLVVLLCGLMGLFGWVFRTASGARWALTLASGYLPKGNLTARGLSGTLRSPLELRDVHYSTDSLEVTCAHLSARWELAGLLRQNLVIRSLELDSLRVRVKHAGPPGATALPDMRLPVSVRLDSLALHEFTFMNPSDSIVFRLVEAHARAQMVADHLQISSLKVGNAMLDASAKGTVQTSGEWPLDLALEWALRLPQQPELKGGGKLDGSLSKLHVDQQLTAPFSAHLDGRFGLDVHDLARAPREFDGRLEFARLRPDRFVRTAPPMTLGGWVGGRGSLERFDARGRVSVHSDSLGNFDLAATLAREGDRLRVDPLLLTMPGRPARLAARGQITGLEGSPRFDFTGEWHALVWPLRGDTLVRSDAGTLRFAGTPARYSIGVTGAIATPHAELGHWTLEGTGDSTHLDIASLHGALHGGTVTAHGRVGWVPVPHWDAVVGAQGFDPAIEFPDWPGKLSLSAATRGSIRDSLPTFEAELRSLGGELRGRPVTGSGAFGADRGVWHARALELGWGDAHATADGSAGEEWHLDASLAMPDLSPLLPEARGALNAKLTLRGPHDEPQVRLTAHADSIGYQLNEVGAVDLSIDAGLRPGEPVQLNLVARRILAGGLPIDRVTLDANGTSDHHTLGGAIYAGSESLTAGATGAIEHRIWRGVIDHLDASTIAAGDWRLEAPAAVTASAEQVALERLCLKSEAGGICALGDWHAAGSWQAKANLTQVPIALLNRFLPQGARAVGTLEGSLDAHADRTQGPLFIQAQFKQSPTYYIYKVSRSSEDTLTIGGGSLTVDADAKGLTGALDLRMIGEDHLEARVAMPGLDLLKPVPETQPLGGHLGFRAADLGVLSPLVIGLQNAHGSMTADFDLGGTLAKPILRGRAQLVNGEATLQQLGITLTEVTAAIEQAPDQHLAVTGSARSGTGTVTIAGTLDVGAAGGPAVVLDINGSDFTAMNTRSAKVQIAPAIHVAMKGRRMDLSGEVAVPSARVLATNEQLKMPQPPSPDVVFVGGDPDSVVPTIEMHARVRLVVGEDVEIRLPGFRGKPKGNILVIDEPGAVTRATGELEITDGTYKAYGQDLVIERGRLVFGGGPITNPGVDIRATRTASDRTVAGFQITGTAEKPLLTVFSEPTMTDADALSYIMFGKPLESSSEQGSLAKDAAGSLGVQGGDMLARGVAGQFGIQDASLESKGGLEDASLFLGTYLNPKLYMAYGVGVFKPDRTLRIRYSLNRSWSVQAESGTNQSGVIQYSTER